MRLRRTLPVVAGLALLAGCAPTQSAPAGSGGDEKTGTVRVWLFDEANRAPKEAAVKDAITEFKAAHQGVEVDVQWVPVEGRADKFSGAFTDQASAPDAAEFGNTDVSSYAATGALADLTGDLAAWGEGKDLIPTVLDTAKSGGKTYGLPWYTGIRALYYRTDVFTELGLKPPTTLSELTDDARKIRAAKPDLYGISVGGKYTYAMLPFLWANGGELAQEDGGKWKSTVTGEQAKAGVTQYANLLKDDICPPAQCANLTGTQSVTAFAGGKAGMTIGGDFNRKAVEQGAVKGKYAGHGRGQRRPRVRRRQPARRLQREQAPWPGAGVHRAARRREVPGEDVHGDGEPADLEQRAAEARRERPVPQAVRRHARRRYQIRPGDPGVVEDRQPERAADGRPADRDRRQGPGHCAH
jgi:N,N'-diacetylchitobiose transport system substrate-binding protein